MTPQQERFIEHYIENGGNATQAAIDAGYSENGANRQASRLLTNVDIYNEVERRKSEILGRLKLDAFNRIALLKDMAFANKTQAKYDNKTGKWTYSEPMADNSTRLKAREAICKLAGDFKDADTVNVTLDGVVFEEETDQTNAPS